MSYEHHQNVTVVAVVQIVQEEEQTDLRRGSVVGREVVHRDRYTGHRQLMADYFDEDPVYNDNIFRRRFRMTKPMFWDIANSVEATNPYFRRLVNVAGTWGFTIVQKVPMTALCEEQLVERRMDVIPTSQ